MGNAGRIVRNSIDQTVFVLMCNGLAPFYRKPHSRGTHFQPLATCLIDMPHQPQPLYLRPSPSAPNQSSTRKLILTALANPQLYVSEIRFSRAFGYFTKISEHIVHILPRPLLFAHPRQSRVSAIGVSIQFFQGLNNSGTNRVKVNITDKFFKICIFLAHNRFTCPVKSIKDYCYRLFVDVVKKDFLLGHQCFSRQSSNETY